MLVQTNEAVGFLSRLLGSRIDKIGEEYFNVELSSFFRTRSKRPDAADDPLENSLVIHALWVANHVKNVRGEFLTPERPVNTDLPLRLIVTAERRPIEDTNIASEIPVRAATSKVRLVTVPGSALIASKRANRLTDSSPSCLGWPINATMFMIAGPADPEPFRLRGQC
jgi:hypothetical protein